MLIRYVALVACLAANSGCEIFFDGDDDRDVLDDGVDRCEPREPIALGGGASYKYVIDSVDLPTTAQEANSFGLNLDLDVEGRPDNALGRVLSTIANALGSDYDGKVAELIADGTILHLIEVRAADLTNTAGAGARVFLGVDGDGDPSDNFDGDESFAIEPGHPTEPMTGAIVGGRIDVEIGVYPLRIAMPGIDEVFDIEVAGGRLVAEVTESGIEGVLAGGLSAEDIDGQLVPFLHRAFANSVALDCPGGECVPNSQGAIYLQLFDADQDGEISLEEVRTNSLVEALFDADVDLFDEDRNFNPRCDGVDDLMSLGVYFTAVPADFAPPAW